MSKNKRSAQCLAVYLYYNEPWEKLLSEAVLPYVQTTLKTGIANHYFFIRYWDRGPHIRLRFFGEADLLENILKPNLKEHFQSYFESKPSSRKKPAYLERLGKEHQWISNNSLFFEQYEPENQRFGGHHGVEIAEQQFFGSSQVVLHQLAAKSADWTYEDALGTAIKLHLTFAHSLGMSGAEARSFFHFFFHNWLPRSVHYQKGEDAAVKAKAEMLANLEAFERAFDSQKVSLIPFHTQFWEALNESSDFTEHSINYWVMYTQSLKARLTHAEENKLLKKRPLAHRYSFWPESVAQTPLEQERWMHYADYLHLTNNRLGVLNKDEGYLGFLMMKSMAGIED